MKNNCKALKITTYHCDWDEESDKENCEFYKPDQLHGCAFNYDSTLGFHTVRCYSENARANVEAVSEGSQT